MTRIEQPTNPIVEAIDKHHEGLPQERRSYLGFSYAGHHCERYIWLTFRWAIGEQFSGRMLRLFRRGHREEETVVADLEAIGCSTAFTGDNQYPLDLGCHLKSGGCDGVIGSGVPGAENTRHLLEVKTHSRKSFSVFIGTEAKAPQTVLEAKPIHYAQMQLCMLATHDDLGAADIGKTDRTLYVSVRKDDDELYVERVRFDRTVAERLRDRGHRIATANRAPEMCMGASPDWWQCKICPARQVCHEEHPTTQVHCRTCAHSTPTSEGTWLCARYGNADIPVAAQEKGCIAHVLHPDMVPWELNEKASTPLEAAYEAYGELWRNGEPDGITMSSEDIIEEWKRGKFECKI